MQHERVSSDIHIFTSELYAQVKAGLIVTDEGSILLDTLPFPEETIQVADYINNHCPGGVQQIIISHHHADHTYGACQFPDTTVVAHALARTCLIERGYAALAAAKSQTPELADVELVLPTVVFDKGELTLHVGKKTVHLIHSPGHTPDSIIAYVVEDKVLFAADTLMPVPTIFDGDLETLIQSLGRIKELPIESLVQGHGGVILRGEVASHVDQSVTYLEMIRDLTYQAVAEGQPRDSLMEISIEECSLSRIPLNGLVQQLHVANLLALYDQMTAT